MGGSNQIVACHDSATLSERPCAQIATGLNRPNLAVCPELREHTAARSSAHPAAETLPGTPDPFGHYISVRLAKWTNVGKTAGITGK